MHVDESTFEDAFISAEQWIANESSKRNGFLTYNEINALFTKISVPDYYFPMLKQFLTFVTSIIFAYVAAVTVLIFIARESFTYQTTYSISENYNININGTELESYFLGHNDVIAQKQFSAVQTNSTQLEFDNESFVINPKKQNNNQISVTKVSSSEIKYPIVSNVSANLAFFNSNNVLFSNFQEIICY